MPMLEVHDRAGVDRTFAAVAVSGEEGLSRLHRYTVDFEVLERDGLSSNEVLQLLGATARITLADDQVRAGLVTEVTLLPAGGHDARVRYRAVIQPRMIRAALSRGHRVYQDARVPGIVAGVLRRHGLELPESFEIAADPVRWSRRLDYVVQHDETDLAFVSRLMERWGLFFFFDEDGSDRVVIADDNAAFRRLSHGLRFDAREEADVREPDAVWGLSRRHRWLPRTVRLSDYNWRLAADAAHPSGTAAVDAELGHGEQQHYGGNLREPTVATHLARVRAEALAVDREVYEGATHSPDVAPGAIFEVVDHPYPELCRAYLVTRVDLSVPHPSARCLRRFEAIPAETPYRAPFVTPWPHVAGLTHGFVAGVDLGAAAAVDESGAYTVSLPHDLAGPHGTRASRPIRKAEPASGADYGVHLPLHVGAEVALAHVHGDPDRPIIVGAVPNASTPSPVREADATKGIIRSRGGVEIELDDATR